MVRLALIGLGAAAEQEHRPAILNEQRTKLVHICDEDRSVLQRRASQWSPVKASTNYLDVVNDPEVDAVIISTPTSTHFTIASAFIKAKKHVLLEAPIGLNDEEAIQLATLAKTAGVVNMTAFSDRFTPALQYIKHLIADGKLGSIRHFRSQRFMDAPETSLGWRQYKRFAGAGVFYDLILQRVDLSLFLLGGIQSVSGAMRKFAGRYRRGDGETCGLSDVDDWGAMIVDFECGATGVFEASRVMKGHGGKDGLGEEWVEVNGSIATAVYQHKDPHAVWVGGHKSSLVEERVPEQFLKSAAKGAAQARLHEFVSAIAEGRPALSSFLDAATAQVVTEAALRSTEERREIDIKMPKDLIKSSL